MTISSYLTFDVSPQRNAMRHGLALLDEMDKLLSFWIIPGINPTYKFVKKRVVSVRALSEAYIKEINGVMGEETYLTEFDAPKGGEYVGYETMMETQDRVKHMRRVFSRVNVLSSRGKRANMRYTAMASRSYIRSVKAELGSSYWNGK